MPQVYIGLGANLHGPKAQIVLAIKALQNIACGPVAASSLYASPPMGPQDQPDYINAVASFDTRLSPLDLLDACQAIENDMGRVRKRHWGERVIDVDILLYGDEKIVVPRLIVPHKGLYERAFVLYPLQELSPDLQIEGENLDSLIDGLLDKACQRCA